MKRVKNAPKKTWNELKWPWITQKGLKWPKSGFLLKTIKPIILIKPPCKYPCLPLRSLRYKYPSFDMGWKRTRECLFRRNYLSNPFGNRTQSVRLRCSTRGHSFHRFYKELSRKNRLLFYPNTVLHRNRVDIRILCRSLNQRKYRMVLHNFHGNFWGLAWNDTFSPEIT